jgi:hypothetical protein
VVTLRLVTASVALGQERKKETTMDTTFRIGEENELSLTFDEADGTIRIDAQEHIWFLDASQGLDLLQWLYERRDILYRKSNELDAEEEQEQDDTTT